MRTSKTVRRDAPPSFGKIVFPLLCLCLLLWCCMPIAVIGINVAVLVNIGVCLFFLYLVLFWDKIKAAQGKRKLARNLVFLFTALFVCGYLSLSVPMVIHAEKRTEESAPTVIVLGCKINGGEPSLMLRRRLDAAHAFLQSHPESPCIVSGGQGADEIMPEGEAMKNYLVAAGIDPERVFVEDSSTSTQENLQFSKEIMDAQGLSRAAVIATDDFHQWRAQMIGERMGLACASAGKCATPWYLLPCYWTREILALVNTLLFF